MRALSLVLVLSAFAALAQVPVPAAAPTAPTDEAREALLASCRPVSLQDALALTAKNSPDLAAARAGVEAAQAKASQIYSVLRPEVKASVSYVWTSTEQKFATSGFVDALTGTMETSVRATGPSYGFPYQPVEPVLAASKQQLRDSLAPNFKDVTIVAHNSLYGNAVISQILFSPQFFLVPAAGESMQAAALGGLEAREQVLLGAAKLYLGLEGLSEVQAAAHEKLAVALHREKDASVRKNLGTATDIDVLREQTETAATRALIANLSGQEASLLAMLQALTGEPVRPLGGGATRLEVKAQEESALPWNETFQVKSNVLALKAQGRFNLVDRASWAPTVVAQAKGSYNSNSGFAGTNYMFDGIVAAEFPLYDRGARYATMRENDAKTAQARAQLEASRAKARSTWLGAKANLAAAEVALSQAESQAQLAARAQKQADSAYNVGMLTSLELSDIDSRRFFAASAVGQARAQLEVRKVELAAAEGRLAALVGLSDEQR